MIWRAKASVDRKKSPTTRLLKSIVLKGTTGGKLVCRLNFSDNDFIDVEVASIPRFDRGDALTVTLYEDVDVPPFANEKEKP